MPPPNSWFPTQSLLAQFNKRDQTGAKGGDGNNGGTTLAIVGLVFAALTLLVAIMSYRHERLRRPLSSLLPSSFVNVRLPPTGPR